MSVAWLAAIVTLAAIPPVHGVVFAATRLRRDGSGSRESAARDANTLFVRAIAPAAAAALVALLVVLPAFVLFEPPGRVERPGVAMAVLAAFGAAYLLVAVARVIGALRMSRACTTAWMREASALRAVEWELPAFAIDGEYPVVAVAGVIRPRLFIDRRVLAHCSAAELAAIAAHERAHVTHGDNLRRLLIAACAGSRSVAAQMWRDAAEAAADERAAGTPDRATDLAGALLKIARLAIAPPPQAFPMSTVHDGGSLEARVQRLLAFDAVQIPRGGRRPRVAAVAVLAVATVSHGMPLLAKVHSFIELFVSRAQ